MKPSVDTSYLHFDETGNIPAIKFARITLSMGLPIIALKNEKGVVVGTVNRAGSPLYTGADKVIHVSDHCRVLVTGHGGDTNQVRSNLRDVAVNHKFVFGSEISPKEVAMALADYLHQLGMSYRRPLGVGIIVVGFDKHGTEPVIYHCDVDGNAIDRNGIALGKESSAAEHALSEGLKAGEQDYEKLIKVAAEATIRGMTEGSADLTPEDFRIDIETLSL
jgi:20S proteasome alpha/beta subunit